VVELKAGKIFLFLSLLAYLSSFVLGFSASAAQVVRAEQPHSIAPVPNDIADSSLTGAKKPATLIAAREAQTLGGGDRMLVSLPSSANSANFSRHIMCKDHDDYYNPIQPTTIFRPSDTKAECLTTVSINDTIYFRWYYRNDSSKTWVFCYNWSSQALFSGEYYYAGYLLIAGHHLCCPKAYKVDVYLDGLFAFSDFFEITNGELSSPRMCEAIDSNGEMVNVKSRFTIGTDTEAYHYFKLDNTAYYNEELNTCHNFTTVWIQPDGNTYKTHSGSFEDYKDVNVSWNFWPHGFSTDDYIHINTSTPSGNWVVKVYLDSYYFNNTWTFYGPVATTRFVIGSMPVADWTFMAYLDADMVNEAAGIDVFQNIASANISSQTNVIVQMDRAGLDSRYGNWTDCKRFKMTSGMTPTPENAILDLNETDMGDPGTLKDFVNWTITNYPANHYCLALWDHGAGFMGVCVDLTDGNDFLSLPELGQALSGLPAIIDVLLVDACSSAMVENAFQVKDYANVLVGPEGLGYAPGPYDRYLSSLNTDTSMSPRTLATDMVQDYISWCNGAGHEIQNATMSAVDLTKISGLVEATDDFAANLKEAETSCHEQIALVRNMTKGYIGPYSEQTGYDIDLYDLAQLMYEHVDDEDVRTAASQVIDALSFGNTVIFEADKAEPSSHGLSIFFPDERSKYDQYEGAYASLAFAMYTQWSDSVKYHLSEWCKVVIQTPYVGIEVDINDEARTTDTEQKVLVFLMPGPCVVNVVCTVWIQPDWRGIFNRWDDGSLSDPRTFVVASGLSELTLSAQYLTEYRLIMTTNVGTTNPPVGEHWYSVNSDVGISATPPNVSSGEQYAWEGWNGDLGIGNKTSVRIDGPINETAVWKHEYSLTIISYDSFTPVVGWFEAGAIANMSVTSPVSETTGMRHVCIGWTGTGSAPANGTAATTAFNIDQPSSINWKWTTQYLISVRTDPVGLATPDMSPPGPWYDNGTSVTCTAIQVSGYSFDYWTVGQANWDQGVNPIALTAEASNEAVAHYTHALAWWDMAFSSENLKLLIAVLGVLITSASITTAWVKTHKRRSTMGILLEEIDKIYLKLKADPKECAKELRKFEGTILERLKDGKITESEHGVLDKKIEKCMKELQEQKKDRNKRQ
jgi:hypothetical protein